MLLLWFCVIARRLSLFLTLFSKLVVANVMTLTQRFCFELTDALLDVAGADVKTCNRRKILD